jgi:signal peptidase II
VNSKQTAPADGRPGASPWRSRRAVAVLVGVVVVGLLADLSSKWLAFRYVADTPQVIDRRDVLETRNLSGLIDRHEPVVILPHVLEFTLVLNPGAVFGTGAGLRVVFIAFTILAVAFGLWMFGSWTRAQDRAAHVAIGLLLAGGLGNLYDRIVYACVRDFIHPLPGVRMPFGWPNPLTGGTELWPYVSNLADLWLLIGIGTLLVFLWRSGKAAKHQSSASK